MDQWGWVYAVLALFAIVVCALGGSLAGAALAAVFSACVIASDRF